MSDERRSAEMLVKQALDPNNLAKLREDPEKTLNDLMREILARPRVLEQDIVVYRIVIITLSLLALSVAGAAMALAFMNAKSTTPPHFPEILTALGSAALGALAGILAPTQTR